MKPFYSFHSHTYRCGHASGDIEDIVKEAISREYILIGTSDHVFLPDISQPRMRGDISLLDEYIDTFKKVKEKYKDKIDMYLAFECEYCPLFTDYYASLLKEKKFDYLLLGQHMTFDENKKYVGYFNYSNIDNYEGINRYKDDLIKGMKTGLFFYVAHPDLFMYTVTEITPFIENIFKEIIEAAIKYDMPLEMNISGFNRTEDDKLHNTIGYPCAYFWKLASSMGVKILYGGDYHSIEDLHNERNIKLFNKMIEENNINLYNPLKAYLEYKSK